jgi:hypothetical protein
MASKITKNNLTELKNYEEDLLSNKKLTNIYTSNCYELLFDNDGLDMLLNDILIELKKTTSKNFDIYIKNMWGFINNENENEVINFNHDFKNGINLKPEFSFIYLIKSERTNIYLKSLQNKIELNRGDILIFETNDFLKEEPINKDRMLIFGSISSIENVLKVKKVIF